MQDEVVTDRQTGFRSLLQVGHHSRVGLLGVTDPRGGDRLADRLPYVWVSRQVARDANGSCMLGLRTPIMPREPSVGDAAEAGFISFGQGTKPYPKQNHFLPCHNAASVRLCQQVYERSSHRVAHRKLGIIPFTEA